MSDITQRYISKELVHFVGRGKSEKEKFQLLTRILNKKWITHFPHNPNISGNLSVNPNARISDNEMYNPEMTCFADIPIEDLSLHMKKYSTFGLSFSKNFIAEAGGVPVHYIPKKAKVKSFEKGGEISLGHKELKTDKSDFYDKNIKEFHELFSKFSELADKTNEKPGVSELSLRIRDLERFFSFHIFSFFKFFDHSKLDDDQDNYYFEREWRIIGNLNFKISDIKTVFLPQQYAEEFRKSCPEFYGQVIFTD